MFLQKHVCCRKAKCTVAVTVHTVRNYFSLYFVKYLSYQECLTKKFYIMYVVM
jgi:hypothetical protein